MRRPHDIPRFVEILGIFEKYNPKASVGGGHDVMWVTGITQEQVSDGDKKRLEELGCTWGEYDCWSIYANA